MAVAYDIQVTGPFFAKDIQRTVAEQVARELLEPIGRRILEPRKRRQPGIARNRIKRFVRRGGMVQEFTSTLNQPRTKGRAWSDYNVRVARSIAARKGKKTAQRVAEELGT